jgi:hypothetical protein
MALGCPMCGLDLHPTQWNLGYVCPNGHGYEKSKAEALQLKTPPSPTVIITPQEPRR